MPILTLGWLTIMKANGSEVIAAAGRTGFKSVSIRITGRKIGEEFESIVGNPARIRELRTQLADAGLRLSNTSTYHLYPEVTLDHVLPAIEATKELGAGIIVATCMDPDHARWIDFMKRYAAHAAQAGIKLALEFLPYTEGKNIRVANDLVTRVDAPNVGFLIDPLHLSRSGGSPADIRVVDPKRIIFAQLCDAVLPPPPYEQLIHEARNGRLFPGRGALPLDDFLDALPADVEIEIEAPDVTIANLSPDEQARQAAAAFRNYLDTYCKKRNRPAWT